MGFFKKLVSLPFRLGRVFMERLYGPPQARDIHKLLRDAPLVIEDAHGMRRIVYPWDRDGLVRILDVPEEKGQRAAIAMLLNPGDVVIDIGAHIGRFTVFASRLTGSKGAVYAFEAAPETFWQLRENIVLNRCQNVYVENVAVCERSGQAKLNLFSREYSAWNTLGFPSMPDENGHRITPSGSVDVSASTLDSICSRLEIERINFLKVDVEGFEKCVFLGAQEMLRLKKVDYICFEISQAPLAGADIAAREVFDLLAEAGYLAYRFEPQTRTFEGPLSDSDAFWANYFASFHDLSRARF